MIRRRLLQRGRWVKLRTDRSFPNGTRGIEVPYEGVRHFSGGLSGLSAHLRTAGSCSGSTSQSMQT
jgi:hypothetical protein